MHRARTHRLIASACILVLIAAPTIWLARRYHQQSHNRALIAAIKRSDAVAVDSLLAEGADPNTRDTPLKHEPLLQMVEHLFRPQPVDLSPTAILVALALRDEDHDFPQITPRIVRALVRSGADPNERDEDGNTPLSSLLIGTSEGTNVDVPENPELLTIITDAGANLESVLPGTHVTPLMEATHLIWPDSMRILLAHGANPEAKGQDGNTPLIVACWDHQAECVRVLLAHGANLDATGWKGMTPLMKACSYHYPDIVRILLDHGANTNARDDSGYTPLATASQLGYIDIAKILKSHGAKE